MECLVAFLCLVACALAADNIKHCPFKKQHLKKIKSVKIDSKDKCELKVNVSSSVQIDFELTEKVEGNVTATVRVFSFVVVPVEDPDVGKTLECPLEKGQSYTYKSAVKFPDVEGFVAGFTDVEFKFLTKVDRKISK